jgi:hypothetical protein
LGAALSIAIVVMSADVSKSCNLLKYEVSQSVNFSLPFNFQAVCDAIQLSDDAATG